MGLKTIQPKKILNPPLLIKTLIVHVGLLVSFKGSVIANFVELKAIAVSSIRALSTDNTTNAPYDLLGLNSYIQ